MLPLASLLVLAVTADGHAAVTADAAGTMRVWRTLDGKREPVRVTAPLAAGLAIARDADGLAIAIRDDADGLAIVTVDASGQRTARVAVPSARAVLDVRATSHAFVALRDDGAVDLVDVHGAVTATLVSDPGHRVGSLAVAGDRVLAIETSGGVVHGRWVELDASGARWGPQTARLAVDPSHAVALAPDGRSVVGYEPFRPHEEQHRLWRIELASGRVLETADVDLRQDVQPLGFVDGSALAWTYREGVALWRHGKLELLHEGDAVAAVGKDVLVRGCRGGLEVRRGGGDARYVGYTIAAASEVVAAPGGWVVVAGDRVLRLDEHFALRAVIALRRGLTDVHVIDARHAIATPLDPGLTRLLWFDLDAPAHGTELQTSGGQASQVFDLDRPSGRIAYGDAKHVVFARYDAHAAKLTTASELVADDKTIDGVYVGVLLLDPARDGGRQAVVLAEFPEPDADDHMRYVPVTGIEPLRTGSATEVAVHRANTAEAFFAAAGLRRTLRVPSGDGAWVAQLAGGRLSLFTRTGELRWSVAVPGAVDLAWSDAGALAIAGDGISRVDVASGAIVETQGAWRFGLVSSADQLADAAAGVTSQ